PYATVHRAEVEDERLRWIAGDRYRAAAPIRPDQTPVQGPERGVARLLAPPGDGGGHERERDDSGGPVDRSVEHEATPEVDRVGESIRSVRRTADHTAPPCGWQAIGQNIEARRHGVTPGLFTGWRCARRYGSSVNPLNIQYSGPADSSGQ